MPTQVPLPRSNCAQTLNNSTRRQASRRFFGAWLERRLNTVEGPSHFLAGESPHTVADLVRLGRKNQRNSTLAKHSARRIKARCFASVRLQHPARVLSGAKGHFISHLHLSPRLSPASRDGCSTQKDVHP